MSSLKTNELEFLEKCAQIKVAYEKKQKEEGTLFNVFSILGLSSKEVRLHSTMIAELLNPNGTHTMNNLFLEKFVELLPNKAKSKIIEQDKAFSYHGNPSSVEVEKYIGIINEEKTKGGRIDIFINYKGKHIIIENKIYAFDQPNQLLRYQNFSPNALILYLTLNGESSNEKEVESFPISYKEFIKEWLVACIKETEKNCNNPKRDKIIQTIQQYKDIITNYLIPSNQNEMTEKIKELILNNGSVFKVIPEITAVYEQLKQDIKNAFWKDIEELIIPYDQSIHTFNNNVILKAGINDDGGFYYGFHLEREENKLDRNDIWAKDFFDKVEQSVPQVTITNWGLIYKNGSSNTAYTNFFDNHDWAITMANSQKREKYIKEFIQPEYKEFQEIILKNAKEFK